MQKPRSRVGATVGLIIGIVVIAGSAIGGLALATDRGRSHAPGSGDSAVTVGDQSSQGDPTTGPSAGPNVAPPGPNPMSTGGTGGSGDDQTGDGDHSAPAVPMSSTGASPTPCEPDDDLTATASPDPGDPSDDCGDDEPDGIHH